MATKATDLWGDIEPIAIRTPASILKEQAALLYQKTNNLVDAEVETLADRNRFYHSVTLVVPALDNYKFELLKVSHRIELYPVHIETEMAPDLNSEEAFTKWLGNKLSSASTKQVIAKLMAQANS